MGMDDKRLLAKEGCLFWGAATEEKESFPHVTYPTMASR